MRTRFIALLLATAVIVPGCSNDDDSSPTSLSLGQAFDPEAPRDGSPVPNSPEAAVALVQWCWNHEAVGRYADVLVDDFRFHCQIDSGSTFRELGLQRDDELEFARHLFVTGNDYVAPAARVAFVLDSVVVLPDMRPGKDSDSRRVVSSVVTLVIETRSENYRLRGRSRFYVVRADSASIPADLRARGFRPNTHRWYVQAWEDESSTRLEPPRRGPTRNKVLCDLKILYR
jgi:hypothetical protein